MATKADVRQRINAQFLAETSEVMGAEDAALVNRIIDNVTEELVGLEVAYWDANDIPTQMIEGLVICVGSRLPQLYRTDRPNLTAAERELEWMAGLRRIKQQTSAAKALEPVRAVYF